ncbi:protein AAR2 homolog [Sabethes cyaneus]|uniref:protein AAR2 homolog n=1 Tax=Sabethes cyaneus TaxID=53552 RepID=UPI00237E88C2|nr:protein AAR2 homolog [Sabethes cyaneus]
MSPETSSKVLENYAFLIIAGVPSGTQFGIDLHSFYVGDNFRGVKLIPPGMHFVYCASQGAYGDAAPRVGFPHYFKRGEIVVREWDYSTEELRFRSHQNIDTELNNIRENIVSLARYMAAYDHEANAKWSKISNITEKTVQTLSPDSGVVRNTVDLLSCSDSDRPRGNDQSTSNTRHPVRMRASLNEDDLLPHLKPVSGSIPNFTLLPPRCPKDASPAEISKHYIDCIDAIDSLLQGREQDIYEEIQFSFILFLCGHSIDGLSHWRKMLLLFSYSEKAAEKYRNFYKSYLVLLQFHLPELPIELVEQSNSNTVYLDVRRLILNCYQVGITSAAHALENCLKNTLLWTFDDLFMEDSDEMPVVVEL